MLSLKHIALDLPDGAELIRDISLDIPEDRVVVVTGPNVGGKTTLAKLIAGLRQPTAGSISFDGQDITHLDITSRARLALRMRFNSRCTSKDSGRGIFWNWRRASRWGSRSCALIWHRWVCVPMNTWIAS